MVSLAHEDVVQEVPVFGAWVLPVPIESCILLDQEIDDYQSLSCTQLRQHAPIGVADANCRRPRTPGHRVWARSADPLKSPMMMSFSLPSTFQWSDSYSL